MEGKIKVLVYPVGKAPQVQEISGLEDMQKIVGGYIEYTDLGAITGIKELANYDLYSNDEGKLIGLQMNRMFKYDFIAGDFFISKANEEGESVSLTEDDIKWIMHHMGDRTLSDEELKRIKNNRQ